MFVKKIWKKERHDRKERVEQRVCMQTNTESEKKRENGSEHPQ